MDSRHFWDDNGGPVKYENENYSSSDGYSRQPDGNLNFASGTMASISEDDGDYISAAYLKKGKVTRQDPMSHRIIEKRRRDRMNNCLADLSRLIPPDYCKKGRGRVEKTEIIEMAIRHLKYLQERSNVSDRHREGPISVEHFRLGYQECRSEVMRYLVEGQGYQPTDTLCSHLVGHLNRHCESIMKGDQLNQPRSNAETTSSSSGSSANYAGDKPSVIAQAHRPTAHEQNSKHEYRKRLYEEPPPACANQMYEPALDMHEDYITLPYYGEEARQRGDQPTTLRSIRKVEREEYTDLTHSYKFKNTIQQRFSQDCDDEAHDMSLAKRRRPVKQHSCASAATSHTSVKLEQMLHGRTSHASSNDEGVCRDAPPDSPNPDEPRELPPHLTPEPPPLQTVDNDKNRDVRIPVFALNSFGKFYVPLNVTYGCLSAFVGPYDLLGGGGDPSAPLHSVTINVNFQPYHEQLKPKLESGGPKGQPV